jgi:serine/threonine-protein kinase
MQAAAFPFQLTVAEGLQALAVRATTWLRPAGEPRGSRERPKPLLVIDDEHDALEVAARERVGTVIRQKYQLDRLLGVGGMASVFAATHLRNGSRVALKLLHPALAANPAVRADFLSEGRAANSVRHSGIVRVMDDDVADDGAMFLVMELLEGETLKARCARNGARLDEREVALIVHRLLDALDAVHAQRVVHCDIKPENVFLLPDGTVKLLDFGIAQQQGGAPSGVRTRTPLGTPGYMPPEQALGEVWEIDARSDVWAVGAMAFRLLSREHVHGGRTLEESLRISASTPVRSLADVAPGISEPFVRVIDGALMFLKDARWPSARAMQVELEQAFLEVFGTSLSAAAPARDPVGSPSAPRPGGVPSAARPRSEQVPTLRCVQPDRSEVAPRKSGPRPGERPVESSCQGRGMSRPSGELFTLHSAPDPFPRDACDG